MTYWDHTECVGLVNLLVDSLDHIYDKMRKIIFMIRCLSYLNSMSDIVYKKT